MKWIGNLAAVLLLNAMTLYAQESIVITAPNGGEAYPHESTISVTWTAAGVNNIMLQYAESVTGPWTTLTSGVSASAGSYSWTPSSRISVDTPLWLRASDSDDGFPTDISDDSFIIQSVPMDGYEENDSISHAKAFTLNDSADLTLHKAGDLDYFYVDLTDGDVLLVEMKCKEIGGKYDTYLNVYDAAYTRVIGDDDGGYSTDSKIIYSVAQTGRYYIQARSLSSSSIGAYRLYATRNVGSGSETVVLTGPAAGSEYVYGTPIPVTWASTGLSSVLLQYAESAAGPWVTITSGVTAGNGGYSWVPRYSVPQNTPLWLRASDRDDGYPFAVSAGSLTVYGMDPDGYEENDSIAHAKAFALDDSADLNIHIAGDQDYFHVDLTAGDVLLVEMKCKEIGGNYDTHLNLYDAAYALVAGNDDGGYSTDSKIIYSVAQTGRHYIQARGLSSSVIGPYRLYVTRNAGAGSETVTLTGPAAGSEYVYGTPVPVSWTSAEISYVMLQYAESAAGPWTTITSGISAGNGSYSWVPRHSVPQDTPLWLRAADRDDGYPFDVSTGSITVRGMEPDSCEENDDFDQAGVFHLNDSTDLSIHTAGDRDYFYMDLTAGDVLLIEMKCKEIGGNYDTYLNLYDSTRTQVAANDDGGYSTDSKIIYTVVTSGRYYAVARALSSSSIGAYRLYIARSFTGARLTLESPNGGAAYAYGAAIPVAWSATGVSTVELQYATAATGPWTTIADGVTAADEEYDWMAGQYVPVNMPLWMRAVDGADSELYDVSDNPFMVEGPDADGSETNNTFTQARVFPLNDSLELTIHEGDDRDYFYVDLTVGDYLSVAMKCVEIGGTFNTYLHLYDPDREQLVGDDDGGYGTDSKITHSVTRTGRYYLQARAADAAVYGEYRLCVSRVFEGERVTLTVPNGGEAYAHGAAIPVTWVSSDVSSLMLQYAADAAGPWVTIASGVSAGSGSYTWRPAAGMAVDTPLWLRVADSDDGFPADISDESFIIQAPSMDGFEENDNADHARAFTLGESIDLTIHDAGDYDYFYADLTAGDVVLAEMQCKEIGGNYDTYLQMFDDTLAPVAFNDDGGYSTDAKLIYSVARTCRYYILARSLGSSAIGAYRLHIARNVDSGGEEVVLTTPNGGEAYAHGTAIPVTWASEEFSSLMLQYATGPTGPWITIAGGITAGSGGYSWTPSAGIEVNTPLWLRAADGADGYPSDVSDNSFVIQAVPMDGYEDNDDFDHAKAFALNDSADLSIHTAGDHDYFHADLTAGDVLLVEMKCKEIGGNYDTYLHVYDTDRTQVAANDDGGYSTDAKVIYSIPRSGRYYIQARALSSTAVGAYRLHVARNPGGGSGTVALTGPEGGSSYVYGETVPVRWSSTGLTSVLLQYGISTVGPWTTIASGIAAGAGEYTWVPNSSVPLDEPLWLRISDGADGYPGAVSSGSLTVTGLDPDGYEENDDFDRAKEFILNDSLDLSIHTAGDRDYFHVDLTAGDVLLVEMKCKEIGSNYDTYLHLYDADRAQVAANDDGGYSTDAKIIYSVPESGRYYIQARALSSSARGAYRLYAARNLGDDVPVVLAEFTALQKDADVVLAWTTESEQGNLGFNLSRSGTVDGLYVQINTGIVPGSGTVSEPREYSFVDRDVPDGEWFYHLEQVDTSGSTEHIGSATVIRSSAVGGAGTVPAVVETGPPSVYSLDGMRIYGAVNGTGVFLLYSGGRLIKIFRGE